MTRARTGNKRTSESHTKIATGKYLEMGLGLGLTITQNMIGNRINNDTIYRPQTKTGTEKDNLLGLAQVQYFQQ